MDLCHRHPSIGVMSYRPHIHLSFVRQMPELAVIMSLISQLGGRLSSLPLSSTIPRQLWIRNRFAGTASHLLHHAR